MAVVPVSRRSFSEVTTEVKQPKASQFHFLICSVGGKVWETKVLGLGALLLNISEPIWTNPFPPDVRSANLAQSMQALGPLKWNVSLVSICFNMFQCIFSQKSFYRSFWPTKDHRRYAKNQPFKNHRPQQLAMRPFAGSENDFGVSPSKLHHGLHHCPLAQPLGFPKRVDMKRWGSWNKNMKKWRERERGCDDVIWCLEKERQIRLKILIDIEDLCLNIPHWLVARPGHCLDTHSTTRRYARCVTAEHIAAEEKSRNQLYIAVQVLALNKYFAWLSGVSHLY